MPDPEENENAFAGQDASRGSSYYYRGSKAPTETTQTPYIDPDQLQTLAEGHFGITNMLLVSFVLALFLWFSMPWVQAFELPSGLWSALLIPLALFAYLCHPTMKKIGIGLNWNPSSALPVSIALGLNVLMCGGAIGFVIVQQTTSNALKKYGIKVHSWGIRRADVSEVVEEMRRRKLALQRQKSKSN